MDNWKGNLSKEWKTNGATRHQMSQPTLTKNVKRKSSMLAAMVPKPTLAAKVDEHFPGHINW